MSLRLMYLTNNVKVAQIAQDKGVDRIFVDLEQLGKAERQGHMDSVKSEHCLDDIAKMRPYINTSDLLVRVNPLHPGSVEEINNAIDNGADLLMLPMFKDAAEVEKFVDMVSGRARTILLLETAEAEAGIDNILKVPGIDEIHIGLNDLHLSHKMKFMFELLTDGTVERLCKKIGAKGIPYGFGGISGIGGSEILPAERILAEHYRLGSSMVILSRSFCNTSRITNLNEIEYTFSVGVSRIRTLEQSLAYQPESFFRDNLANVKSIVNRYVSNPVAGGLDES